MRDRREHLFLTRQHLRFRFDKPLRVLGQRVLQGAFETCDQVLVLLFHRVPADGGDPFQALSPQVRLTPRNMLWSREAV